MNVPSVMDRGYKIGLHSLAPEERDVYVVYDLQLHYEMEGSFADHIPNAPEEFDWLEGTLLRIGDAGSLSIIRRLRALDDPESAAGFALCDEYEARSQTRWSCLERCLATKGIELRWESNEAQQAAAERPHKCDALVFPPVGRRRLSRGVRHRRKNNDIRQCLD
jgi:hypothetical protein